MGRVELIEKKLQNLIKLMKKIPPERFVPPNLKQSPTDNEGEKKNLLKSLSGVAVLKPPLTQSLTQKEIQLEDEDEKKKDTDNESFLFGDKLSEKLRKVQNRRCSIDQAVNAIENL